MCLNGFLEAMHFGRRSGLREDFEVGVAPKGRMSAEHDEEHHPQGPNVHLEATSESFFTDILTKEMNVLVRKNVHRQFK